MTQTGHAWTNAVIDHTFNPSHPAVDQIDIYARGSINSAFDDELSRGVTAGFGLDLLRDHDAYGSLSGGTRRVGDVEVPWGRVSMGYSGIWTQKLRGRVDVSAGQELDYSLLVPARAVRASVSGQWRPTAGTRFDLTAGTQFLVPEGEEAEAAATARLRGSWQLSRQLGVRVIGQTVSQNTSDETDVDLSALLTWLRTPGTEAYLGTTQALVVDGDVTLLEQFYFFKVSWLFRP